MRLNSDILDLPTAHANEHSLEVQLPFLQHHPLRLSYRYYSCYRTTPRENVIPLSHAIAEAMSDRSYPVDWQHRSLPLSGTYEAARKIRSNYVIEAIGHFDTDYLRDQMDGYMQRQPVQNLHCMMCSTGAIYTTMRAWRKRWAETGSRC